MDKVLNEYRPKKVVDFTENSGKSSLSTRGSGVNTVLQDGDPDPSLTGGSSKSGAKFIDLDGVISLHPNKTEGGNLVIRVGILRRICGKVLVEHYTDHNNIDFTAKGVLDKLKVRNTKSNISRWANTGIVVPLQHLSDNVYDMNKLSGIQVFTDTTILEALLTCNGKLTEFTSYLCCRFL